MRTRAFAAVLGLTLALGGTLPAAAATKSYTMAQVQKHRQASDCWTVINGSVYNLTKWVNRHPGGRDVIVRLCGRNGSAAFTGQHGSDGTAKSMLASYRLGKLKK